MRQSISMTYSETMAKLKALGNEKMRQMNCKNGAGENHFGVKMGDIRALAKEIKTDPQLAAKLWESGNIDAMFLATLIMKPKELSVADLDRMLASLSYCHLVDWFGTNVVKQHPDKEAQRERWMKSKHDMTARMGWSLTAERIVKNPDGLNMNDILDRLEKEMSKVPNGPKWNMNSGALWTMNYCLAEIGINFPEHRKRALAIAEKIGAFKDYPVSKGCTSPYAPIWIAEMVKRKS